MFPLKMEFGCFALRSRDVSFKSTPLQSVYLSSGKLLGEILSIACWCLRRLILVRLAFLLI